MYSIYIYDTYIYIYICNNCYDTWKTLLPLKPLSVFGAGRHHEPGSVGGVVAALFLAPPSLGEGSDASFPRWIQDTLTFNEAPFLRGFLLLIAPGNLAPLKCILVSYSWALISCPVTNKPSKANLNHLGFPSLTRLGRITARKFGRHFFSVRNRTEMRAVASLLVEPANRPINIMCST